MPVNIPPTVTGILPRIIDVNAYQHINEVDVYQRQIETLSYSKGSKKLQLANIALAVFLLGIPLLSSTVRFAIKGIKQERKVEEINLRNIENLGRITDIFTNNKENLSNKEAYYDFHLYHSVVHLELVNAGILDRSNYPTSLLPPYTELSQHFHEEAHTSLVQKYSREHTIFSRNEKTIIDPRLIESLKDPLTFETLYRSSDNNYFQDQLLAIAAEPENRGKAIELLKNIKSRYRGHAMFSSISNRMYTELDLWSKRHQALFNVPKA